MKTIKAKALIEIDYTETCHQLIADGFTEENAMSFVREIFYQDFDTFLTFENIELEVADSNESINQLP